MSKDKNNNAKKQIKIDSTEQPPTPIITLCKKKLFQSVGNNSARSERNRHASFFFSGKIARYDHGKRLSLLRERGV